MATLDTKSRGIYSRRKWLTAFLYLAWIIVALVLTARIINPNRTGAFVFMFAIAIAMVFGLIHVIGHCFSEKKLRFFCPNCSKYIPISIDWICDGCDGLNNAKDDSKLPFLEKCWNCNASPTVFTCHYCIQDIILSEYHDGPPRRAQYWDAKKTESQPQSPADPFKQELRNIEQQTSIVQMKTRLALALAEQRRREKELKEITEQRPERTAREKLEDRGKERVAHAMGIREIAFSLLAEARRKYPAGSHELAQEEAVINAFVEENLES